MFQSIQRFEHKCRVLNQFQLDLFLDFVPKRRKFKFLNFFKNSVFLKDEKPKTVVNIKPAKTV